jgi:hypothetical protein
MPALLELVIRSLSSCAVSLKVAMVSKAGIFIAQNYWQLGVVNLPTLFG